MSLIKYSIKFRLSCYSNFTTCNDFEALFFSVVKLISLTSTSPFLFSIAKTSLPKSTEGWFHHWSRVNSVVCFKYRWSKKTIKPIDSLCKSTKILVSTLIAVFDQPNEISFFKGFVLRRSLFSAIIQSWQIFFDNNLSHMRFA